jgi:signal peptidase I
MRAARKAILLVGCVLAVVAVLVGFRLSFRPYIIASGSMEKTLMVRDGILVDHISTILGRLPQRGDVTVFRYPIDRQQIFVHRIVGIPGDRLAVRNKTLYRNGAEVLEPYAQHITKYVDAYRDNFPSTPSFPLAERAQDMIGHHVENGELVVPAGMYFVMGDNRDDAVDSRYFGLLPRGNVIGRAIYIYASQDPKRVWKRVD